MKTRTDIINYLIEKNGYEDYLEIGVCNPAKNYDKINCKNKTGVDPKKNVQYQMTSDKFFEKITKDVMYDIIFVDGMHLHDYALRDINNSLNHLYPSGAIVVHDCNPTKEDLTRPYEEYKGGAWCGTTWKAIAQLRMKRKYLRVCTVNTDYGCAVIKRGVQTVYKPSPDLRVPLSALTKYKFLENNRKELLNLVSVEEFKENYA